MSPERLERSWRVATLAMVVMVWIAVIVISVFAPALVSGSEQESLPLAAFSTWLWGTIATASLLWTMGKLRGDPDAQPIWRGLEVAVGLTWLVATVLALSLPRFETGSDPTQIPFGALFAPIAATVLTGLGCVVAVVFSRPPQATTTDRTGPGSPDQG